MRERPQELPRDMALKADEPRIPCKSRSVRGSSCTASVDYFSQATPSPSRSSAEL